MSLFVHACFISVQILTTNVWYLDWIIRGLLNDKSNVFYQLNIPWRNNIVYTSPLLTEIMFSSASFDLPPWQIIIFLDHSTTSRTVFKWPTSKPYLPFINPLLWPLYRKSGCTGIRPGSGKTNTDMSIWDWNTSITWGIHHQLFFI